MSSTPSDLTSLKLSFNGEIRRLSVSAGTLTYDSLLKTTLRIYPNLTSIQFSWVDDEDDKVMISSDEELSEALRVMTMEKKGYLRFEVTSKTCESADSLESGSGPSKTGVENATSPMAYGTIIHVGVQCDQCGANPISGARYKCSVRQDFDLCESCEVTTLQPYPTVKIYSPAQVPAGIMAVVDEYKQRHRGHGKGARNAKHRGITCDECQSRNFTGFRYKCSVRPDFDLCSFCEAKAVQPFAMIKFYSPNQLKSIEVAAKDHIVTAAATATAATACREDRPDDEPLEATKRTHKRIRCDSCGVKPIIGLRYSCSVRPNFDLCKTCKDAHPQPHPMLLKECPSAAASAPTAAAANIMDHMQMGVSNGLGWIRGTRVAAGSVPTAGADKQHPASAGCGGAGAKAGCNGKKWLRHNSGRHCWDRTSISKAAKQKDDSRLEDEQLDMAIQQSLKEREEMEREAMGSSMITASTAASSSSSSSSCSSSTSSVSWSGSGRTLEELSASIGSSKPKPKPKPKQKLMARFVKDVTMPDGSQVAPCSTFYKTWRMRNDGPFDWPEGCHLVTAGGDVLVHPNYVRDYGLDDAGAIQEGESKTFRQYVQTTPAGEEVDITVELCAPASTGRHVGYFRLEDPAGSLFGQRLWSDIRVTDTDMAVSATLSPWEVVDANGESTEDSEDNIESSESSPAVLRCGCTVMLHGLVNQPKLNGQLGVCMQFDAGTERWQVELHDSFRLVMLQQSNLAVCDPIKEIVEEEEEESILYLQAAPVKDDDAEDEVPLGTHLSNSGDKISDEMKHLHWNGREQARHELSKEELEQMRTDVQHIEQQEHTKKQLEQEEQEEQKRRDMADEMELLAMGEEWKQQQGQLEMAEQQLEMEQQDSVTAPVEQSEEDGEVAAWKKELEVLREMGFEDREVLLPLLRTHVPVPASLRDHAEGQDQGTEGAAGQQQEGLQAVVWALLTGP